MKLSHILTTGSKITNVRGKFEKTVLHSGKQALTFTIMDTGNDEKFLVLASLKNWPRFEKWVGHTSSKCDLQKTSKTFETIKGEELQGILMNARVVIRTYESEKEDEINDE